MNRLKKILITSSVVFSLSFLTSIYAEAAPCYNKLSNLKQPDNTEVKVKITGDEYYQQVESLDGYTLCRNSDGWICYASLNGEKSELVATDEIYKGEEHKNKNSLLSSLFESKKVIGDTKHLAIDKKYKEQKIEQVKEELNANKVSTVKKTNSNLPSTGNINGLTILINFPDKDSDISAEEINKFFNLPGYTGYSNNGSVRDYFYDVSGGKVTYTNTVTTFYTAKHNKSYYDNVKIDDYSTSQVLANEALNWLKSAGFDFSTLTTDSNGYVKGVNILYAGEADAGWAKGLWPHQDYLSNTFSANGVNVQRFELSNIGSDLSLFTICHENGHLLFEYPDLYDYTYKSNGCGAYSLMSNVVDVKNPEPPDPYCRNIMSGWNSTLNLNSYSDGATIAATADGNGTQPVYKWSGNNSKEYYLIENLQKSGRYSSLPDAGLMIWHIDETGDNSDYGNTHHNKVSVVQADNKFEIENMINNGNYGDLFHQGFNDTFNNTSSPSSKWLNNSPSGLDISNISSIGNSMTFVKSGKTTGGTTPTLSNIASKAVATTSYCSSWENISALNDGVIPTSSNDRSHAAYGNWPKTDTQWVQYAFDKEYTISKSDVYWFKDGSGIDVPASYRIAYWDGSQWLDVPNAKGFGTLTDQFNTTTFDPIKTSAIAIQMESNNSASTGILEWRLY
ncbi:M6 family metalloprotease domain-containing protein [Clostridium sp. SHJSY1]|uniref:M6 family metalloprotease domain-containing protein n=1 Tax=Clostridium sp. SHJSY1 TaxID=2942483 RepID=UPI002874F124|nr:M6 family metalloprotease domain-containing protein [Clostridium sp. SHJSY1]MDS0527879.1 M6 family metalloprotease domain-containing protein [Clostridium sp. SHJSY1]